MNPTTDVLEQRVGTRRWFNLCTAVACPLFSWPSIPYVVQESHCCIGSCMVVRTTIPLHLPRLGITVDFIEDLDAEKVRNAIKDNTKLVYLKRLATPRVTF